MEWGKVARELSTLFISASFLLSLLLLLAVKKIPVARADENCLCFDVEYKHTDDEPLLYEVGSSSIFWDIYIYNYNIFLYIFFLLLKKNNSLYFCISISLPSV